MIHEPPAAGKTPAPDALEEWYRAAIAETMRPCRELSREDRAAQAALAAVRDERVA